ncbi:MAG: hypothetical protein ACKVPY_04710 [Paracoccaceae bacterium]
MTALPRRLVLWLLLPLLLAGCGADRTFAPDEAVQKAAFVSGEPPSITLLTVLRKPYDAGAHSALMIDASQRVIFDPAGTWGHPRVPVRNDVHYGITEQMRKFYIDYHARESFDVVEQKVYVTPETAELALRLVQNNGAVPKALCGSAVSGLLRQIPGFQSVPLAFNPLRIMKGFGQLPGVTERRHLDGDPDDHSGILIIQAQE